jgi:Skp family chaperone for outer membrane proteins
VKRKNIWVAAALGALCTIGAATAQPPAPGAPGGAPPAAPQTRPTIAVFNMAAVMRDFGQAKYQVWVLNNKKTELSKNIVAWRSEYIDIQKTLTANPNHPQKDQLQARQLKIARDVEDEDRKINKQLNDDASAIIADLYDKIKVVVDRTADANGYHVVFAYPDAVTQEELKSPFIKELKLKPPAAQPFYVAAHADMTPMLVKTLNGWYPPKDAAGNLIDVSKLELPKDASLTQPQPGTPPQPPMGPGVGVPGVPPK